MKRLSPTAPSALLPSGRPAHLRALAGLLLVPLVGAGCATWRGAPSGSATATTATPPPEKATTAAPKPLPEPSPIEPRAEERTKPTRPENLTVPARPLPTPAPMSTVLLADASRPAVSIRLVFRAGSIDDPPGKEGLTALTARLMAQGGTEALSAAQLNEALFPMAGEISESTGKEITVFAGRVPRAQLERFLPLFTDVVTKPRLDEKELARLRTDALNAITTALRNESDEELAKVGLDELLYEKHPYRHYVGGTAQGLATITAAEVRAHAARVFTQDRLVIGLAGPVDSQLETRVKQRLSTLPTQGAARVELPPVAHQGGRVRILQKASLSTAISAGYPFSLRRGDPDYFAVAFALSYLGEHRQIHGRLFDELREKRGLNYGSYAYVEHFEQEGYQSIPRANVPRSVQDFSIWIRPVEAPNAFFAVRAALYFLDEVLHRPLDPVRFESSRGFLLGLTRLWEQSDQRRLAYAIDDLLYGTGAFLESYRQALASMTPEQVQEAARRHLRPELLNYVFVTKDAKGLAEALAEQKPSPIRYPTSKPAEVTEVDQKIQVHPVPISADHITILPAQGFMEK